MRFMVRCKEVFFKARQEESGVSHLATRAALIERFFLLHVNRKACAQDLILLVKKLRLDLKPDSVR